jgi:nucleoside-diphosphate-sugar epimerase
VAGRTALVTGGAGFIGSRLAEALLEQGWEVYALDDLSTVSEANIFQFAQNPYFHLTVEAHASDQRPRHGKCSSAGAPVARASAQETGGLAR